MSFVMAAGINELINLNDILNLCAAFNSGSGIRHFMELYDALESLNGEGNYMAGRSIKRIERERGWSWRCCFQGQRDGG